MILEAKYQVSRNSQEVLWVDVIEKNERSNIEKEKRGAS